VIFELLVVIGFNRFIID